MLANRSFDFTSDKKSVPAELVPSSCILCVTASPGILGIVNEGVKGDGQLADSFVIRRLMCVTKTPLIL